MYINIYRFQNQKNLILLSDGEGFICDLRIIAFSQNVAKKVRDNIFGITQFNAYFQIYTTLKKRQKWEYYRIDSILTFHHTLSNS